jgi:hypothetical protein
MSDEQRTEAQLDNAVGKKFLIIEWDIESGNLSMDAVGWQAWQLSGVAAFLEAWASTELNADAEDFDTGTEEDTGG